MTKKLFINELECINGRNVSFVRCNDWDDEVILFFHVFTGSKGYFPEIDDFNGCIISFDRPGVGGSDILEFYSMEDFLEDIIGILKRHDVSSCKLIGHSAGGYYAQVFCNLYPDMVKSLSLVSSVVPLNSPKTKKILNAQWKFISFLSLKFKRFSKFYFKKMANGIIKDYDKQLEDNLKTVSKIEREFMEDNHELIKNSVLNAVKNDGLGVYYDAFALCQPREDLTINEEIPVYIWHGTSDDTTPVSFAEYLKKEYSVKQEHIIPNVGHMLYLPYWKQIIEEII